MTRYIAFLRAINVGKHNRIKMEALRTLCSAAGLANVRTYLQTGNVVFETSLPERETASLIEDTLAGHGLRNVVAAVRQREELEALLATNAFGGPPPEGTAHMVTLYRDPFPPEARAFAETIPGVVAVTTREICQLVTRADLGRTDANAALQKRFKLQGTSRYWHVVEAATALLSENFERRTT